MRCNLHLKSWVYLKMRNAFADEITKLAVKNKNIVLLSGDIGNRLFDKFKTKQPNRFYNCGVAEQNMTGVAAGLSMSGLLPLTYTIAQFCTTRCLEQIRTDLAYHELPSIIVAVGGGLSYAGLGPTHHACEDISFLKSIPNMKVLCPADPNEVRLTLREAIKTKGPVYLRLGKKGEVNIEFLKNYKFQIGQAYQLTYGKNLAILSTGTILEETIKVFNSLKKNNIEASLFHFPTVKPLDQIKLNYISENFSFVVTVEEHSIIGGFGSSIAEWFVDNQRSNKILRIATPDTFYKKSGSQTYARNELKISSVEIEKKIFNFLR